MAAKLALNKVIKTRKRTCFDDLCQAVNMTLWGGACKVVMAKMKDASTPPKHSPEMLQKVVETHIHGLPSPMSILAKARLCISAENIKAAIEAHPDMFRVVMRMFLDRDEFLQRWKRQMLVLLPKHLVHLRFAIQTNLDYRIPYSLLKRIEADGLYRGMMAN